MRRFGTLALLAVMLAGCATPGTKKNVAAGLLASGQSLLGVSTVFNRTSTTLYFPYCLPKIQPGFEKFCPAWKAFAKRFDEVFPPSEQAWQAAVKAGDTAQALGAQAAVMQLSTELAALTASVIIQHGAKP